MDDDLREQHRKFHEQNPHVREFIQELIKDWPDPTSQQMQWWVQAKRRYLEHQLQQK